METYILKSTLFLGIFLGAYYLLLSREKMHRFNRFYLLSSLVLSLVLPFVEIPFYVEADAQPAKELTVTTTQVVATMPMGHAKTESFNYWAYGAVVGYAVIVTLLAVRFTINVLRFYQVKKRNTVLNYNGATLVLMEQNVIPHTFLNTIFINRTAFERRLIEPELLTHELAHVYQKHTLDVLFVEVLKTVFWFNPLLYLYKKAIQTNHEFLADAKVLSQHLNMSTYQLLLLEKATPPLNYTLASGINFSTTKKRFIMMTKTTTERKSLLLKVLTIPVLAMIIMAFSTKKVTITGLQPVSVNDSLDDKQRRDAYYKGVKVDIDDRIAGVHLVMPYEQLSEQQKRKYYFMVPAAIKPQVLTQKEYDRLKDAKKYYVTIDDVQTDNTSLKNYKAADFASYIVLYRAKGSLTKERPQFAEYHLFSSAYYNKNHKEVNVTHFPDSIYKIQVFKEVRKGKTVRAERAISYNVSTVMQYLDDKEPVNYTKLDKMPEYKTGIAGFNTLINQHLKLPDSAPKYISTYYLSLIIEADGVVSRVKVINAEDAETPKAFAAVLEKARYWNPGILKGKAVRSQYTVKVVL